MDRNVHRFAERRQRANWGESDGALPHLRSFAKQYGGSDRPTASESVRRAPDPDLSFDDKYFVAHKLRLVAEARRLAFEGASTGSLKTVARRLAKEEFGLLSQDDKDTFFAEVAGCANIPRAGHFKRGLEALTDETLLVDIPVPSPTKRRRSLNAKLIAIGSSFVDQLRRLGCDSACDSGSVGKDKQLRVQLARLRAAVALQSGADELQSSILCTQAPKGFCLETLFLQTPKGGTNQWAGISNRDAQKLLGIAARGITKTVKQPELIRFGACGQKGGRPAIMPLTAIREALLKHTSVTCRWAAKYHAVQLNLKSSISSIHALDPELHMHVSRRTLTRAIGFHQNNRLGIGFNRKATDCCPVCQLWDHVVSKRVHHQLKEIIEELQVAMPGYWEHFQLHDHFSEGGVGFNSAVDVSRLQVYIEAHAKTPVTFAKRQMISEKDLDTLQAVEALALDRLQGDAKNPGVVESLEVHNLHWGLRDYLGAVIQEQIASPDAGELCVWEDYQEPLNIDGSFL